MHNEPKILQIVWRKLMNPCITQQQLQKAKKNKNKNKTKQRVVINEKGVSDTIKENDI